MKICITWTSSWIWKYLWETLQSQHEITWISRRYNTFCGTNFQWDLCDENFINNVIEKSWVYDYIILNAGVWFFNDFISISKKQHTQIISTNLTAPILLLHGLLNQNKIKKWIIFIGSHAGKKSMKFGASYCASKFGLRWFAMQLKNELKGIKVHIVNPKIVSTDFHKHSSIPIHWIYQETSLHTIWESIKNILGWAEKKFEIDL